MNNYTEKLTVNADNIIILKTYKEKMKELGFTKLLVESVAGFDSNATLKACTEQYNQNLDIAEMIKGENERIQQIVDTQTAFAVEAKYVDGSTIYVLNYLKMLEKAKTIYEAELTDEQRQQQIADELAKKEKEKEDMLSGVKDFIETEIQPLITKPESEITPILTQDDLLDESKIFHTYEYKQDSAHQFGYRYVSGEKPLFDKENNPILDDKGKQVMEKIYRHLTNFVIIPLYCIDVDDKKVFVIKLKRIVEYTDAQGQKQVKTFYSEEIPLTASDLSGKPFKTKLVQPGFQFHHHPSEEELNNLANVVIMNVARQQTKIVEKIGYQTDGELKGYWVYGNTAVSPTGEIFKSNKDNLIRINNRNYKTVLEGTREIFNMQNFSLAPLNPEYRKLMLDTFLKNQGGDSGNLDSFIILGWIVYTIMNPITDDKGLGNPYLFLTGPSGGGKTFLGRLIYTALGFTYKKNDNSVQNMTVAAFERKNNTLRDVVMWLEEWKREDSNKQKLDALQHTLLSFYEKQNLKSKATLLGTKTATAEALLLITGETAGDKDNFLSRCITLTINGDKRAKDRASAKEVNYIMDMFKEYYIRMVIKLQDEEEQDKCLECIDLMSEALADILEDTNETMQRMAKNFALISGCFLYEFGDLLSTDETTKFVNFIRSKLSDEEIFLTTASYLDQYLEDLELALNDYKDSFDNYIAIKNKGKDDEALILSIPKTIKVLDKLKYKNGQYDKNTVLKYLKDSKTLLDGGKGIYTGTINKKSIIVVEIPKKNIKPNSELYNVYSIIKNK